MNIVIMVFLAVAFIVFSLIVVTFVTDLVDKRRLAPKKLTKHEKNMEEIAQLERENRELDKLLRKKDDE